MPTSLRRRPLPHRVYVRRRLTVLITSLLALGLTVSAGDVLADRGGDPASTPTIRLAHLSHREYVVQPGDTLWSIASSVNGGEGRAAYIDSLVAANGGADLDVGQILILPTPAEGWATSG